MHPAAGGPPVVVERLAELAPACGWSASIITTSRFCEDDGAGLEAALSERLSVKILRAGWAQALGFSPKTEKTIRDGIRSADIVHLHTLWHPLNTLARRACEQFGKKYVLSPHGMLDPYSLGVKAFRKRLYMKLREARNLTNASCIIFTTPLEEQLARMSLPWLGRGKVISLGADEPPRDPARILAREFVARFPEAAGRRCMIFLGRIHEKKGLEYILKVLPAIAAQYPNVLLIVAGSGEPRYVANLQAAIKGQGIGSHVLFTGLLQDNAKWGALAASEMFLLPSHQENFAVAAAEAMQMGIPVILSDKVNLWPLVLEAGAGLVISGPAATELEAAILRLLTERELSLAMGQRGRSLASNFIWKNTARRTCELYEEILGEEKIASRERTGMVF